MTENNICNVAVREISKRWQKIYLVPTVEGEAQYIYLKRVFNEAHDEQVSLHICAADRKWDSKTETAHSEKIYQMYLQSWQKESRMVVLNEIDTVM